MARVAATEYRPSLQLMKARGSLGRTQRPAFNSGVFSVRHGMVIEMLPLVRTGSSSTPALRGFGDGDGNSNFIHIKGSGTGFGDGLGYTYVLGEGQGYGYSTGEGDGFSSALRRLLIACELEKVGR